MGRWLVAGCGILLCGSMALGQTQPAEGPAGPDHPPATQPTSRPADHNRSLKITPAAINALHQVMVVRKLDPAKFLLRIGVKLDDSGAMRGYILDFTDQVDAEKDIITPAGPFRLVINREHVPFLEGITVDYDPSSTGASPFIFRRTETPNH